VTVTSCQTPSLVPRVETKRKKREFKRNLDPNSISLTIKVMQVKSPRLPQLKLFLKIISIFYLKEDTNEPIIANVVKKIIRDNHIFNNVVLALRPRVIKISPKSDISTVWFNI